MSSLGFATPTTEDIVAFLFFLIAPSIIVFLFVKIFLLKFGLKKTNSRFTTDHYILASLIVFLTFYLTYSLSRTLSLEIIVPAAIFALINLVISKILTFIFNLNSIKKMLVFAFILFLALFIYPKKYTSEVFERLYEGSPSESIICRCAGLINNNICFGYKFRCEIEKHTYL